MAQDQRQHALPDRSETDDNQTPFELGVNLSFDQQRSPAVID
jgi:hypothetical protein